MRLKIHTLIKGIIWELLGVLMLSLYTLTVTGDWISTGVIGLGYPAIRMVLWYPYERTYKCIRRRNHNKIIKSFNLPPINSDHSERLYDESLQLIPPFQYKPKQCNCNKTKIVCCNICHPSKQSK